MPHRLNASMDSPLLTLAQPLALGICLGLNFPLSSTLAEGVLISIMLLGMVGLSLAQRKQAIRIFSFSFQQFFQGVIGIEVCLFGVFWGSHGIKVVYTPVTAADSYSVVVMEPPVEKAKTYALTVRPRLAGQKWLLYVPKDSLRAPVRTGDFLQVQTRLQVPVRVSAQGITRTGFVRHWEKGSAFPLSWWSQVQLKAMQVRSRVLTRLDSLVQQEHTCALVHAMLLGDKTDLTPTQKEAYTAAGLSHLLALSGMHLGFILVLLNALTTWCVPWLKKVLVLVGLWGFILLTGLPVSAVRAGVMLSFLLLNPFPGERTMTMDRWALAFVVLLLLRPAYLLDIGFQLSFAAVAGIVLLLPCFPEVKRVPKFLQDSVWLCISAQVAVLPFSLWHFGTFPVYFLLANLLVSLWLAPLFIYLSIAVLMGGSVPVVGTWLCQGLLLVGDVQQHMVSFLSSLPGGVWHL